jgi:UDP-2-acetamido-2-deoxy-ribo-hexuluronate aminotransferase
MSVEVPFLDLQPIHSQLLPELMAASERVYRHGRFIGGAEVDLLEQTLAEYVGVPHCVTCSSGTMALTLSLMALGIAPGDEVIVPAYTFAAPVEAVLLLGATPVLADIDVDTCTLSVESAQALITSRTRAIIAVSLYGQPADLVALEALVRAHGIALIEDGAQSFGGRLHGRRSGAFGDLGCTSFYPSKPLGGCGDGGAVFTRDDDLARLLRSLRDHGQAGKYHHVRLGLNARLDTLSCAALLVKFTHFPTHLSRRAMLARRYDAALASILPTAALRVRSHAESAYALYCLQLDDRDHVCDRLADAGIATAVHYPTPLHLQPAFATRCRWADLSVAERAARRGLCLPLYPALDETRQDTVIATLDTIMREAPDRSRAGQSLLALQ